MDPHLQIANILLVFISKTRKFLAFEEIDRKSSTVEILEDL